MATNISQAFNEFKSRLELTKGFQERVTTHHKAIRDWVESYDSNIETKLIGSLQRATRIQPLTNEGFDIDILVILGEFYKKSVNGISPSSALDRLEDIVKEHGTYKKIGVEEDSPVILFEYSDGTKVELVPGWRDFIFTPKGRGYRIPKRGQWESADYDFDAEYISAQNKKSDGYLVPVIKMLKSSKRSLFPQMQSYHLEVLASDIITWTVNYFKKESLMINFPNLIFIFFYFAKDQILNSSQIPGSKSPDASKYLSEIEKGNLSKVFKTIADYSQTLLRIEGREAIEGWKKIFGEPFPSYG